MPKPSSPMLKAVYHNTMEINLFKDYYGGYELKASQWAAPGAPNRMEVHHQKPIRKSRCYKRAVCGISLPIFLRLALILSVADFFLPADIKMKRDASSDKLFKSVDSKFLQHMDDPTRLGFQLFTLHLTALRANSSSGERPFVSSSELKSSWDRLTAETRLQWIQRAMDGQRPHPKTPPKTAPRSPEAATSAQQGSSSSKKEFRGGYITFLSRRGALLPTPRRKHNFLDERARRMAERREDFRRIVPNEADVDSEDDEIGVPVHVAEEESEKGELEDIYHKNRQMVFESIIEQTGGCLDKIKFSTIVGPWEVSNEVQRGRATFHSHETHRIPLAMNKCKMDKRQLVMEILGRSEPSIACQQGLRVGLYRDELEDLDERMNRLYVGERDLHHLVDESNRRWIISLTQEFHYMTASMKHLQSVVGLEYQGFPTSNDRFVLANAFVDALADCLGGSSLPECSGWLNALGTHLPEEFATPWERSGELFCERHRAERNSCYATFIMIHSLEDLLKE